MQTFKDILFVAGWLCFFVTLMLWRSCCIEDCPQAFIVRDTIPGDSVPYPIYKDKPFPVFVYKTDTIPANVDTAAILNNYFALVYYSDTLVNDTSYRLIINDTIHQNRIAFRQVFFQNLRPTAINTTHIDTFISQNTTKLFATLSVAGSNSSLDAFTPGLTLITKGDNMYGIGTNILQQQPNINATIGFKILPNGRNSRKNTR
jgi:hypothetical protein